MMGIPSVLSLPAAEGGCLRHKGGTQEVLRGRVGDQNAGGAEVNGKERAGTQVKLEVLSRATKVSFWKMSRPNLGGAALPGRGTPAHTSLGQSL